MRERRILLGLTQQQIAELIGVTYRQANKYERGINRVAAGRLYGLAQALGVEVGYFFEELESSAAMLPPQQRMLLDLVRNYLNISDPRHREAILVLAKRSPRRQTRTTGPDESSRCQPFARKCGPSGNCCTASFGSSGCPARTTAVLDFKSRWLSLRTCSARW
jgi:transcriptional regulator with XRE-family HTH domain